MRCAVALLVLQAAAVAADHAVNYCGSKMCSHTNRHTFCQYGPGPSPECRGYMDAELSTEEKARVLARLNRRRSEAASGRLRRLPTAGNMLKLRWVEELAREAQRWADQCRPYSTPDEQDACRDLYSTTVGQCVASVVGEAPGLRVESMVDLWYMQSILYKGNVTSYIIPMSNVSYYGDFAQMVWSRSYMVGCGRSRFMSEWNGRLRSVERLVCNIAPRGPPTGRPLWTPARPSAACPPRSHPDPELPALCSFRPEIDISSDENGTMTIEEHVLLSTILEIESNETMNYLGSLDAIHLTKLALVTMDNAVDSTRSYDNAVQKRAVVRILVEDDAHSNDTSTRITIDDVKKYLIRTTTTKVNIIGRPKPYDLGELNDADGDSHLPKEINYVDQPDRDTTTNSDRDLYLDYAFLDAQENVITVPEMPIISSGERQKHFKYNKEITTTNKINDVTEDLVTVIFYSLTQLSQTNVTSNINSTEIPVTLNYSTTAIDLNTSSVFTTKSDEDYLTDPETVREIQEALERMERSLEQASPPSGKVRRDLRDRSPDGNDESEGNGYEGGQYRPTSAYDKMEAERNKSLSRGPMLNMVLKYMPYLKPYEREILGIGSRASYLSVSYALFSFDVLFVLSMCF